MALSLIIFGFILAVNFTAFGLDENLVPYTLGGTTIMVDPNSIGLNSPLMKHLIQGMPSRGWPHNEETLIEPSGHLYGNTQSTQEKTNPNYIQSSSHEQEIDSSNYEINVKDSQMQSLANFDNNYENNEYTYNSNHDTNDSERNEENSGSDSSKLSHTNSGSDFVKTTDGKLAISINSPSPITMEDAGGIYLQDEHLQNVEDQSTNENLYYSANIPSINQVHQQVHRIVSNLNKQTTVGQTNDRAPIDIPQKHSPRIPPIPNAEPLDPEMFILDPRPLQPVVQPPSLENTDGFAGMIYDPDEISTFDSAFIDEPESTTMWEELDNYHIENQSGIDNHMEHVTVVNEKIPPTNIVQSIFTGTPVTDIPESADDKTEQESAVTNGIIGELLIDDILTSKEQDILKDEQEFKENLRIQEEAQQDLNEAMGTILGTLFRNNELKKNNSMSESSKEDEQQISVNTYYFNDNNESDNHGNQNVPEIYDKADIPEIFRNKDALEEHFSSLEDSEKPVFILPSNDKSESNLSEIKFISKPSLLSNFPLSREDPNSPMLLKDSDPHKSSVLYYSYSPTYPLSPITDTEASGVYINGEKVYTRHVGTEDSSLHSWFDEEPIKIFDPDYNSDDITRFSSASSSSGSSSSSSLHPSLGPSFSNPSRPEDNNIQHGRPSIPGYQPTAKPGKPTFSSSSNGTDCVANCKRIRIPVCGSDGETYNNLCMLELAACEGYDVTLAHEGQCTSNNESSSSDTCAYGCQRDFNPVCGSDGKTYNNKCSLEVAACEGVSVALVYEGRCDNRSLTTTTIAPGEEVIAVTTVFEGAVFHSATPSLTSKNTCRCGLRFNNKIVGGEPTTIESYPWQVGITAKTTDFTYCAGSIINDLYILTAAHCVLNKSPEEIHVRLAETSRDGPADIIQVNRIHMQEYTKISHHDIALIELQKPIKFSATKMPVCLPPHGKQELGGEKAIVTGWGRKKWNGELADGLREVSVEVMSNSECEANSKYEPGQVHKKIICAASRKKDACQGDSGGPLVHQIGDHYEQIGIVSWGIKCAKKSYPGIYTKVSAYRNWIDEIAKSGVGCRDLKKPNQKKEKKKEKEKKKGNKRNSSKKNRRRPNKNKRNKNKKKNRKNKKEPILSAISDLTLKDTETKVSNNSKCKSNCQRERIPVCGSNGKTYNNLCMLVLEACEGVDVTLAHEGECEIKSSGEVNENDEMTADNTTNKNKDSNKKRKQQNKRKQESSSTSTEGVEDDIDWSNLKQAIKAIAASVDS